MIQFKKIMKNLKLKKNNKSRKKQFIMNLIMIQMNSSRQKIQTIHSKLSLFMTSNKIGTIFTNQRLSLKFRLNRNKNQLEKLRKNWSKERNYNSTHWIKNLTHSIMCQILIQTMKSITLQKVKHRSSMSIFLRRNKKTKIITEYSFMLWMRTLKSFSWLMSLILVMELTTPIMRQIRDTMFMCLKQKKKNLSVYSDSPLIKTMKSIN